MTKHDFKQHAYYMIYLIRCVLHNQIPKKEKIDKIDLSTLYEVAKKHSLTAITAYALESVGVVDERFTQAKAKAIRKNALFDIERQRVFAEFDKASIWYMPLKGIILQAYYPRYGMRQMADNDFLIDKTRQNDIKDIMLSCGFKVQSYDISKHDVYFKEPVCNFQMHISLFEADTKSYLYNYFKNIDERLIKDPNSKYGMYFTDEDFYLYIKAHEYKHFSSSGTGLRNLVDTYLYLRNKGDGLDCKYLDTEFKKLEFADYEKNSRELSLDLFNGKRLNDREKKLLDYYIFSGTYGNTENLVENQLEKSGGGFKAKIRYLADRFFVPVSKKNPMYKAYKVQYPAFYNNKL